MGAKRPRSQRHWRVLSYSQRARRWSGQTTSHHRRMSRRIGECPTLASALRLRPRRLRVQGFLGTARPRDRDVLLRAPQSASRVGFKACETPGGLNPHASDVHRTDRAVRLAVAYHGRPICERKLTSEGSVHGPSLLVRHPVYSFLCVERMPEPLACERRISLRASIDRKVSCFRSGAIRSPQTMSKIAWATAK